MHLDTITVFDWRGIQKEPLKIEFNEGLNVVTGPNETNKSTLVEALQLAFSESASSQKAIIKQTRPWGSALCPRVIVEFSFNKNQYKIDKTFLRQRENAELSIWTESDWKPVARDREVDEQLKQILQDKAFVGLANSLWARQGKALELLEPDWQFERDVKERITQVLAATISPPEGVRLLEKTQQEWNKRFTKTLGKIKTDSDLNRAKQEKEQREQEFNKVQSECETYKNRVSDLETEQKALQTLTSKVKAASQKFEELKARKQAWDKWRLADSEVVKAHEWWRKLNDFRNKWDSAIDSVEKSQKALIEKEKFLEQAKKYENKAKGKLEKVEGIQKSIKAELDTISTLISYAELLKARQISRQIKEIKRQQSDLNAPTEEQLKQLRQFHTDIEKYEEALKASELKIGLTPEKELSVSSTVDDEAEESFKFAASEHQEWKAAQRFSLKLDGIARLYIQTGMEEAAKAKGKLTDTLNQFDNLLKNFNALSLKELEERFDRAGKLKQRKDELQAILKTLRPMKSEKEIEEEVISFEIANRELLDEDILNGFTALAVEALDNETARLKSEKEQKEAKSKEAEEGRKEAHGEWLEASSARTKANTDVEKEKATRRERLEHLNNLKKEIQNAHPDFVKVSCPYQDESQKFSPEKEKTSELYALLSSELKKALDDYELKKQRTDNLKPEGEEVTQKMIDDAEEGLNKLQQEEIKKGKEVAGLEGEIKTAADGIHEKLAEAEERLYLAEQQCKSEEQEAKAYDLLLKVLNQAKDEATQSIIEPVKNNVIPRLKEMTGNRYLDIQMNVDWKPESLKALGGLDAPLVDLSYGTREQISFLVRLAIAEILAKEERQLLILDDSLVNTDTRRMNMACKFLEEVAKSVQTIIFTCHPDKYQFSPENVKVIPLEC